MSGIQITGMPGRPIEGLRLENIRLVFNGGGLKKTLPVFQKNWTRVTRSLATSELCLLTGCLPVMFAIWNWKYKRELREGRPAAGDGLR